jgi:hypothetical protein
MQQQQQQGFEIRDIAQDGNEFYVFMSLCLFDSYVKAPMLRDVLTTFLCVNAFSCSPVGSLRDDAKIAPVARKLPWFGEWEQALTALSPDSDLDHAGVAFIRMNARQGFRTPIRVACALMHTCYTRPIHLYAYDERSQKMVAEMSATWATGAASEGGIYLLLEAKTNNLRLMVTGSKHITPDQIQRNFPGASSSSTTSDAAKQSSEYVLMGYDPELRRSFEVAYFVSPAQHGIKSACNVHILPIDAQRTPKGMKCSIAYKGSRRVNALSVFALRGERGKRAATLINFWQISFAEPVVDVQMLDEMVVIVESGDVSEATAVVHKHFACTVSSSN